MDKEQNTKWQVSKDEVVLGTYDSLWEAHQAAGGFRETERQYLKTLDKEIMKAESKIILLEEDIKKAVDKINDLSTSRGRNMERYRQKEIELKTSNYVVEEVEDDSGQGLGESSC